MTKDEITDFYSDFQNELIELEKEDNRCNIRLIKILLNTKGFKYVTNFLKEYSEDSCYGKIMITTEPKGKLQPDYRNNVIKGIYVNQHNDYEDDYYGEVYYPVKESKVGTKYLKCSFQC
jgi:hypothetical protein